MTSEVVWRWAMAHRRWFNGPVRIAGIFLVLILAPFVLVKWIIDWGVARPLEWALDWLEIFRVWTRMEDDDAKLARFIAMLDRRAARKAQELPK